MTGTLQRVITGAAALIITAVIISFSVMYYRSANSTVRNGAEKINVSDAIDNTKFSKYDGMEVLGANVVRLISLSRDETISIQVTKMNDADLGIPNTYNAFIYNLTADITDDTVTAELNGRKTITVADNVIDAFEEDYKNAKTVGNDMYIPQDAKYIGRLLKSKNGSIIGIAFEAKTME